MTTRPRASFRRVLEDLGTTLLELVCGDPDATGALDAVGLVVRAPVPVTLEIATAVQRSGVALLGLTRGASWAQLAAMVRSLIAEGDIGEDGPETLGGMLSGDLFALANAVA